MVVFDEREARGRCEVVGFVAGQPVAPADVRDRGLDDRLVVDVRIGWGQDGAILLAKDDETRRRVRAPPFEAERYFPASFAFCSGVRIPATDWRSLTSRANCAFSPSRIFACSDAIADASGVTA